MPAGNLHIVEDSECVSGIAETHGFFWETIWSHPENAGLKEQRKEPNVLLAGDVVFVPSREEKQEIGATDKRHKFRKKGVPALLRFRLLSEGKARTNLNYVIEVDGTRNEGTTDAEGQIEIPIHPNARIARLLLPNTNPAESYLIGLGRLDPITEASGVGQRLVNLGYHMPDSTAATLHTTIRAFQADQGLPLTGKMDGRTRDTLLKCHGS